MLFVYASRRQPKRAVSLVCSVFAVAIAIYATASLSIFNPYYWYIRTNEARMVEREESSFHAQQPAFVVLENKETFGAAASPPLLVALINDESDELKLKPDERSAVWEERTAGKENRAMVWSCTAPPSIRDLHGHFFLLENSC